MRRGAGENPLAIRWDDEGRRGFSNPDTIVVGAGGRFKIENHSSRSLPEST